MACKNKTTPKLGAKKSQPDKAANKTLASPDKAATQPLTDGNLPEANVGLGEICIQPSVAEDARPDSGGPCEDGWSGV